MKLFAEVGEESLLFSLTHERGTSFYRLVGNGEHEVVYFSGNRIVHFKGKLSQEKAALLEQTAWKVDRIDIDESNSTVKIIQVQMQ